MKKLIALIISMALFAPVMADTGTAKVKAGPVGASINNAGENQSATVSKSGNVITFGTTYSKSKIDGVNSSATGMILVMQFDSIVGDLEEGVTYDLSHSNPSTLTTVAILSKIKNLKGVAITTAGEDLADSIPTATGKLKVTKYDPETGLISGNLSAKIAPVLVTTGGKTRVSSKGINVKMSFTDLTLD